MAGGAAWNALLEARTQLVFQQLVMQDVELKNRMIKPSFKFAGHPHIGFDQIHFLEALQHQSLLRQPIGRFHRQAAIQIVFDGLNKAFFRRSDNEKFIPRIFQGSLIELIGANEKGIRK